MGIDTDVEILVLGTFYCCFTVLLNKHVTAGQDISCKSLDVRNRSSSKAVLHFRFTAYEYN